MDRINVIKYIYMTANEVRQKYFEFMIEKGYKLVNPVNLIIRDDPTTLFTGSGMQPMVPYLLGQKHSEGELLTNSQPCLRTQDIEEVGDNRHTTFFEMLGDWSLDGFSKEKQIRWLFEFLTNILKLNPEKLYVTCFIGDRENDIPRDNDTALAWQKVFNENRIEAKMAEIGSAKQGDKRGIKSGERIFFYDDKENWWSRNGGISTTPKGDPCGPDNEVFYDFGEENVEDDYNKSHPASDNGRFMEICNKVWMQYRREENGNFSSLPKGKVDFGGGLSRLLAASNNSPDIFLTDLYQPIIREIEKLSSLKYSDNKTSMRIIADHLTGAAWLSSQGLTPSNKEQGYVLRRLVRRAIMKALDLGIDDGLSKIIPIVIEIYSKSYPDLPKKSGEIITILTREETIFRKTLHKGLREFDRIVGQKNYEKVDDEQLIKTDHIINGNELFKLRDTYGFPLELSLEEAQRREIKLSKDWRKEFDNAFENQRQMSQTASKGEFKGGLTGETELHKKYHTAAHLLGAALREVLKTSASQKGSNINDQRLRLDFAHPQKLTSEQLLKIEELVNQKIKENLPVTSKEYETNYAFDELKAIGEFRDKYGDKVAVYTIGDEEKPFSVDICGGPHVKYTGELGHFKIIKEESSSAGVRRLKAILE